MFKLISTVLLALCLVPLYHFILGSDETGVFSRGPSTKDKSDQSIPQGTPDENDVGVTSLSYERDPVSNPPQRDGEASDLLAWSSEESLYEIEEFRRTRGYHIKFEESDYNSYSLDVLEQLADSGDFSALHILAFKYQKAGRIGDALNTYAKAAAHGSTSALRDISDFYQSMYYSFNSEDRSRQQRKAMVDALAHYKVAEARGDQEATISAESFIKASGISLSKDDQLDIRRRSEEIFQKLLREREKLGLGKFDNHIPPNVEAYYDSVKGSEG